MCMSATCPTCSKQSWRGCGSHVQSVFSGVPEDKWCTCEPKVDINGKKYPPAAKMNIGLPSWMTSWMGGGNNNATGDNSAQK
ncbi:hypothetical protein B0T14DRAFT_564699 [Immersiella caudata]|uniref:Uncharacterized protein n=1 Tax=Immersiella caudata TaxID=314043 RepID=A0AA39WX94_9PEZI|nr:hypothetical protein B0T14DRAFT_564699 [Immersiella caudata]